MKPRPSSKKQSRNSELLSRIHRGHYHEAIDKISSSSTKPDELTALICALAFRGRLMQAMTLWRVKKNHLNLEQRLHSLFHLSVSATRASKHHEARAYLREMGSVDSNYSWAETCQAIAFYFYFSGHFRISLKWAQKAYHISITQNSSYFQILSMDLMSHSLIQTGKISEGLKLFGESIQIARQFHYDQILNSIHYSKRSYEIEIGKFDIKAQFILEKVQSELKIKNSYSHSQLALDQSRLLLLEGRLNEAELLLNRCAPNIYSHSNRRQEIHLLIRFMQLAFLRGNLDLCRQHLRSAELCLKFIRDKTFEVRLKIIKYRIQKEDSTGDELERLRNDILNDYRKSPFLIDAAFADVDLLVTLSESDFEVTPLAKRILKFNSKDQQIINAICDSGKLGLLASLLKMKEPNCLALLPNGRLLLKDQRQIALSAQKVSPLLGKLLQRLQNSDPLSKALLVEKIWNYRYDPLRHDSIVYVAIQNLRKLLGSFSYWIETDEQGWQLNNTLKIVNLQSQVAPIEREFKNQDPVERPELNHRQSLAMKELPPRGFWTVPQYKIFFSVSNMTAYRDLAELVDKKIFLRRGHGKLTTYHYRPECAVA